MVFFFIFTTILFYLKPHTYEELDRENIMAFEDACFDLNGYNETNPKQFCSNVGTEYCASYKNWWANGTEHPLNATQMSDLYGIEDLNLKSFSTLFNQSGYS